MRYVLFSRLVSEPSCWVCRSFCSLFGLLEFFGIKWVNSFSEGVFMVLIKSLSGVGVFSTGAYSCEWLTDKVAFEAGQVRSHCLYHVFVWGLWCLVGCSLYHVGIECKERRKFHLVLFHFCLHGLYRNLSLFAHEWILLSSYARRPWYCVRVRGPACVHTWADGIFGKYSITLTQKD